MLIEFLCAKLVISSMISNIYISLGCYFCKIMELRVSFAKIGYHFTLNFRVFYPIDKKHVR